MNDTTYYILYGNNEDGGLEIIFGDYDLDTVKYEKESLTSLDYTKMKIKTFANDCQAGIDAWFNNLKN